MELDLSAPDEYERSLGVGRSTALRVEMAGTVSTVLEPEAWTLMLLGTSIIGVVCAPGDLIKLEGKAKIT